MGISTITKPYTHSNGQTADGTKVNANDDTVYSAINNLIGHVNNAAGTKSTLQDRLDVTLNPDGTARSGVTAGGEWINPELSPTYLSSTQFTVAGDHTDIYLVNRRLKVDDSTAYHVVAASYSAGTGLTTITINASFPLPNPISKVEHGILSPLTETHSFPYDLFSGMPPYGSIISWVPGYFGNGSNGSYTSVMPATNDVAGANAYLNPFGWYVCDGSELYRSSSPIFNGAGRYLPLATNDIFLMGDTLAGGIGGTNTMQDHLHGTFSLTAAGQTHSGNSPNVSTDGAHAHSWTQRGDFTGSSSKASSGDDGGGGPTYNPSTSTNGDHDHTVDISHTHAPSAVSGTIGSGNDVTSTENRPNYLSCFFIMRVH